MEVEEGLGQLPGNTQKSKPMGYVGGGAFGLPDYTGTRVSRQTIHETRRTRRMEDAIDKTQDHTSHGPAKVALEKCSVAVP